MEGEQHTDSHRTNRQKASPTTSTGIRVRGQCVINGKECPFSPRSLPVQKRASVTGGSQMWWCGQERGKKDPGPGRGQPDQEIAIFFVEIGSMVHRNIESLIAASCALFFFWNFL